MPQPYRRIAGRSVLLASAVTLLLAFAGRIAVEAAQSSLAPVTSIAVTGNRSVEAGTITSALALKAGAMPTSEAIDRSIKQLFATGLFSDVSIRPAKDGSLTVTVVERARIVRVVFEGNTAIETKKLEEAAGLKAGAVHSRAKAMPPRSSCANSTEERAAGALRSRARPRRTAGASR